MLPSFFFRGPDDGRIGCLPSFTAGECSLSASCGRGPSTRFSRAVAAAIVVVVVVVVVGTRPVGTVCLAYRVSWRGSSSTRNGVKVNQPTTDSHSLAALLPLLAHRRWTYNNNLVFLSLSLCFFSFSSFSLSESLSFDIFFSLSLSQ